MMSQIICSKCNEVIAYTNKKIPESKTNYLHSKKLTVEQKGSFYDRRRSIYCKSCYENYVFETRGISTSRKQELLNIIYQGAT
jgi:hypothetical protein